MTSYKYAETTHGTHLVTVGRIVFKLSHRRMENNYCNLIFMKNQQSSISFFFRLTKHIDFGFYYNDGAVEIIV